MTRLMPLTELVGTRERPGLIPVSRASVWRWVRAGRFPAPVRIGPGRIAWREADIREWIDRLPSAVDRA